MNVKALIRDTPSECFEEWKAAFRVEPWGEDWKMAGTIAAAAVNPHIKKQMSSADFIPKYRTAIAAQSIEEMEVALMGLCGIGVA